MSFDVLFSCLSAASHENKWMETVSQSRQADGTPDVLVIINTAYKHSQRQVEPIGDHYTGSRVHTHTLRFRFLLQITTVRHTCPEAAVSMATACLVLSPCVGSMNEPCVQEVTGYNITTAIKKNPAATRGLLCMSRLTQPPHTDMSRWLMCPLTLHGVMSSDGLREIEQEWTTRWARYFIQMTFCASET